MQTSAESQTFHRPFKTSRLNVFWPAGICGKIYPPSLLSQDKMIFGGSGTRPLLYSALIDYGPDAPNISPCRGIGGGRSMVRRPARETYGQNHKNVDPGAREEQTLSCHSTSLLAVTAYTWHRPCPARYLYQVRFMFRWDTMCGSLPVGVSW